jgi:hypothetical protein
MGGRDIVVVGFLHKKSPAIPTRVMDTIEQRVRRM